MVDRADLLDPAREAALAGVLAEHEARTSNQVVVATVPTLGGRAVASFAIELANAWSLGDAERDNGALLLVAPNEREVRIEVGRGLEGALTDARSGRIIRDEILPAFRDGDYPTGIERGVDAMLGSIDGEHVAPAPPRGRAARRRCVGGRVPLRAVRVPGDDRAAGGAGAAPAGDEAANGAFPAGFAGLLATVTSGSLALGLGVAAGRVRACSMPRGAVAEAGWHRLRATASRAAGSCRVPMGWRLRRRDRWVVASAAASAAGGGGFGGGGASGSW